MVWEPKTCCCGCSPKTGTLILGWFGLIGSALSILGAIVILTANYSMELCYNSMHYLGLHYISMESCADHGFIAVLVMLFIIALPAFAIYIMLLWGVYQNKPKLMLPFLICQIIRIGICGNAGIMIFFFYWYGDLLSVGLLVLLKLAFLVFLDIYFLLVVRVCYIEIKHHRTAMGDANKIAYLEHQDIPAVEESKSLQKY